MKKLMPILLALILFISACNTIDKQEESVTTENILTSESINIDTDSLIKSEIEGITFYTDVAVTDGKYSDENDNSIWIASLKSNIFTDEGSDSVQDLYESTFKDIFNSNSDIVNNYEVISFEDFILRGTIAYKGVISVTIDEYVINFIGYFVRLDGEDIYIQCVMYDESLDDSVDYILDTIY